MEEREADIRSRSGWRRRYTGFGGGGQCGSRVRGDRSGSYSQVQSGLYAFFVDPVLIAQQLLEVSPEGESDRDNEAFIQAPINIDEEHTESIERPSDVTQRPPETFDGKQELCFSLGPD